MAATKPPASRRKRPVSNVRNVAGVVGWVADESALFTSEDSPFFATVAKGAPKLAVVTGENASGKSLFVRVAADLARKHEKLPVSVSVRERTGSGLDEMAGLRRAFMFGDEHEQSTGATSVKVVATAFRNLDRPEGSMLILDEPEMGLAEAYTRALGEFIGQQARDIPAKCIGVIVVTHSRPLVQGLCAGYDRTPTHVAVSADAPAEAGVDRWLDTVEHRTVAELLALQDVGLDRWRRVLRIIEGR